MADKRKKQEQLALEDGEDGGNQQEASRNLRIIILVADNALR